MGNTASVVPNESDGGRKDKQPKAQRRKESYKEAITAPKAQRPRRSEAGKVPSKDTDVVAKVSPLVKAPEAAPTPPKSDTGTVTTNAAADPKDHAPTVDSGPERKSDQPKMDVEPDLRNDDDQDDPGRVQREKPREKEVEQKKTSELDDGQPKENTDHGSGEDDGKRSSSRERTVSSEANSSGSNSSSSYTSSTYSSGSEESGDDDASDDTFFVPEVHQQRVVTRNPYMLRGS